MRGVQEPVYHIDELALEAAQGLSARLALRAFPLVIGFGERVTAQLH